MMKPDKLHFKTHIQLKSIIGKDLINDDNIAILELVKNAYDANSKEAKISFLNITSNDDQEINEHDELEIKLNKGLNLKHFTDNTSRIIIQDHGVGMNRLDIEDKWLNIAYSEKKIQKKQFNRILAGAKGVGRFSCDRLGEYLNIYSRKENENYVHLFVDWKLFEVDNDKDLTIQGVDIAFEEIIPEDFEYRCKYPGFEKGTILEITKLRSNWTYLDGNTWSKEKLLSLKKQLEKLINPNQAYVQTANNEQNTFKIILNVPEFEKEDEKEEEDNRKLNGEIRNKIFEKLNFRTTSIWSEISSHGKIITTILQDKGKTIFRLVERNQNYLHLDNTAVTLYYLNPYSKSYFTRQMGFRSVEFGSIYLFINGFRIPPYGEEGDDWLRIEIRKGQGYGRYLGTREVIGRIEIVDEQDNFKIISSREGVVKNSAFMDLADYDGYFFKTFKRLEKYVVDGIGWDSVPQDLSEREQKAIERRILEADDWSVEEEVYRETDKEKFARIYNLIHSIIGAKPNDVISLYVNEELILEKAFEERRLAEQEFERILEDFSKNKISVDMLNRVLDKKATLNKELQKQLKEFAKYSTEEATARAIVELEALKELNGKHQRQIKDLIEKVTELENQKKKTEEDIVSKDKLILFQQKLLTHDLEQLLEYHHNIGIAAGAIDGHLINLKDDLQRGKIPSKEDLFDLIESVSYETNKITSITNLATAANFNADADVITADLEQFVRQYIDKVKFGKLKSTNGNVMTIEVNDNEPSNFTYEFKPLEIAIVLDNLFSNSRKAGASKITVSFIHTSNTSLQISIKDNGSGVKQNLIDKIFNFGFTTTSGSGMGLHHIQKILKSYNGDVELNLSNKPGAEFILIFNK